MIRKNVRFGENLRVLRDKNKLSQEKLAQQINVARQTISTWEDNIGKPDIYMLARISEILIYQQMSYCLERLRKQR